MKPKKKPNEPYLKEVRDWKNACPDCDAVLLRNHKIMGGYQCHCSEWRIDWLTSKWNRIKLDHKDKLDEGRFA